VIGQHGIGKKTSLTLFRGQHRGGKGVKIASVDEKLGKIAFAKIVDDEKATVVITSALGQVVKIPIDSIPVRSRNAKGVILMRFSSREDYVTSATFI
jgi:DNA gyrase subunit A